MRKLILALAALTVLVFASGASAATFNASRDAYVSGALGETATNYGTSTVLQTDGDPFKEAWIRFDPKNLAGGAITSATLRLQGASTTTQPRDVRRVSASWVETDITWDTKPSQPGAPTTGAVQGTITFPDTVSDQTLDVTAMVNDICGGKVACAVAFAVTSPATSVQREDIKSREAVSGGPRLDVTSAPPGPLPAVPTAPPNLRQDSAAGAVSDAKTQIRIRWDASSDDVAVVDYTVKRNGVGVETRPATGTLTHVSSNLTCGTSYTFEVRARDGATPQNVSDPSTLVASTAPCAPVQSARIMAAGDISCGAESPTTAPCKQMATSDIFFGALTNLDYVLTLGDNQYEEGQFANYQGFFHPSWGRAGSKLMMAPGNHEWIQPNAQGYRDYDAQFHGGRHTPGGNTWFAFDAGPWRVYSLDSDCSKVGGCSAGNPQYEFVKNDLLANPRQCVMAYWHHPTTSLGNHGNIGSMDSIWALLYDNNADLVLSGHDHNYQRFAPLGRDRTVTPQYADPGQPADFERPVDNARGIRELVVGTGGRNFTNELRDDSARVIDPAQKPGAEVWQHNSFGVVDLTLTANGYSGAFVPAAGYSFTDTFSGTCH